MSTNNNLADDAIAWLNGETFATDNRPVAIAPFIINQEIIDNGK